MICSGADSDLPSTIAGLLHFDLLRLRLVEVCRIYLQEHADEFPGVRRLQDANFRHDELAGVRPFAVTAKGGFAIGQWTPWGLGSCLRVLAVA